MKYCEQLRGRSVAWYGFSFILIVIFLAACGGGSETAVETIRERDLSAGDSVPSPAGDTVLVVSGDISNTNAGDTLIFDMEALESLGLVRYTVSDPWQQKEVAYTGVLMSDLLAVAGVGEGATAVNVVALDDYAAEIPISEIDEWPIILATQDSGQYMDVDNSGPTRIIFPFDTYSDLSAARNMAVWNVGSMEVR